MEFCAYNHKGGDIMVEDQVYAVQAEYFKALSHPVRIRIVHYLKEGERCVCEIVPYLKEEQSNVPRHLTVLRRAGALLEYLSAHVLTCLISDFSIAGAISSMVRKEVILRYFGSSAVRYSPMR